MYDNKKKFRRSPVTVICYVLAALMLIYTCYQIGNTIHTINEYYAQYGMQATPVEYLTYVGQSALTPLLNAVFLFMFAKILDEVRKNNPANYQSDEDIVEAGIAKKEAKDAKKFEKGEKAAAKAGHTTSSEDAVIADFTADDDKTVTMDLTAENEKTVVEETAPKKPAAKKSTAKKTTAKKSAGEKAAPKKTAGKKSAPKKKAAPKKTAEEKPEETEEKTVKIIEA